MKTSYVARVDGESMAYFAGFAPGGQIVTGDRNHAVPFMQISTAEAFKKKLNEREEPPRWFTVTYSGDFK